MRTAPVRSEDLGLRLPGLGPRRTRGEPRWPAARVIAAVMTYLVVAVPVWGDQDDPYQAVISANEAFEKERFDEALSGYESALEALGESPELDYNRAAAHYKLGRHAEAANLFAKAAMSPEAGLSRRAKFNWGNCDYAATLADLQSASPETGQTPDLAGAVEKLDSAIRHYRDALTTGGGQPGEESVDQACRSNIERAQRLIDQIKEMMQQQRQQQQNDQDQQEDEQQDQNDQQQQGEQDEQQQDQQQQEQQQQQDQQEGEQQEQPQPDPQQEREMTPEEVQAVLQAVRDKEKQRREEKMRKIRAQRVPVVEDW